MWCGAAVWPDWLLVECQSVTLSLSKDIPLWEATGLLLSQPKTSAIPDSSKVGLLTSNSTFIYSHPTSCAQGESLLRMDVWMEMEVNRKVWWNSITDTRIIEPKPTYSRWYGIHGGISSDLSDTVWTQYLSKFQAYFQLNAEIRKDDKRKDCWVQQWIGFIVKFLHDRERVEVERWVGNVDVNGWSACSVDCGSRMEAN